MSPEHRPRSVRSSSTDIAVLFRNCLTVTSLFSWTGAAAPINDQCMENTAETVQELTADTGGRWLVTTQGSTHIWDLDAWTYTRIPGKGRGDFVGDGVPQRIWCVGRFPCVGESFYVELDDTASSVQTRLSTEVVRIERITQPAAVNQA